jgi:tRNA(Ile)-lysidine synthetase-like protein
MLEQQINNFVKKRVNVNNNIISFSVKDFLEESEFFQIELLFSLLKPYELATTCVKEIIKKINSSKTKIVTDINNELVLIKEYGQVNFVPKTSMPCEIYLKIENDGIYRLPNNKEIVVDKNICYLRPSNKELWYNIPELPIIVRTRKKGDSLRFKGGTKTISNYLTDKKISQIDRMKILLICDKDDNPIYMIK